MNEKNQILFKKNNDILILRELSDSTITAYSSYLSSYINWVEENFPDRELQSITSEEIRLYLKFLKDSRKLNPRTINGHVAQLRTFYHQVLGIELDRYQVPTLRFEERLPSVPNRDEVQRIINAIDNPKHKAEIILLYSSGIRIGELCHLHCRDIKMSQRQIYITPSKNHCDRYAILADRALVDLSNYIRTSYPHATQDDWLFPGQKPGTCISTESVRRVFMNALEASGLADKGFTPHSLRHSFGLELYESCGDLMTVKEAMGHKSLASTTVYLTLGVGNGRKVRSPYDLW